MAKTLAQQIKTETHTGKSGELRWNTNDQPVPLDCFRDAGMTPPTHQARIIREENEKFFAEYRKRQPRTPSAEEQFEMRAAFGPGVDVVDVISGRRFRT